MSERERLSIRAAARMLGVAHVTLMKALDRGRLVESVVRDAAGRTWLDADRLREEWESSRKQLPPRAYQPAVSRETRAAVGQRLAEAIAEEQAFERELLLSLVSDVVVGAAEELRRLGQETTEANLTDALALGPSFDVLGAPALLAMRGLIEDGGPASAERRELARRAGREAVRERLRWKREATHGEA
ncbi:hypothetical protein [Anaeromyxobacter dehalogenans]|uniref:Helix-turn-helix domain-containing protein n=1 Tax=Anaeromyxobacter dehalogenans (strain 2CP-C) TaxID=290397 RepID=Q2IIY2_ANADE|nr:hypothetical protein [Anaeromyxobacter dehalogenans]ABC81612.1 hypothetical protein Adeh_1840 [Anaeromyxobacter dehalogenans 2CP-C]